MTTSCARVALLGLLVAIPGPGGATGPIGTIGLVPDPNPERQARVLEAIRSLPTEDVAVVVGEGSGQWQGTTDLLRRMLDDSGVDVLFVPSDRSTAHLVAQVATRRHVPAIELAFRGSPEATTAATAGSYWLVTCDRPADADAAVAKGTRPALELEVDSALDVARSLLKSGVFRSGQADADWRLSLPPRCRSTQNPPDGSTGNRSVRFADSPTSRPSSRLPSSNRGSTP